MGNLVSMDSLIKKVYFPRQIIILATLIAKVIDLVLSSLVFVFFMVFFGQSTNLWLDFLYLPLIFIIQFIFTYGICLLTSALNVFYRDIQYLMSLVLLLWFYLTPVIYPVELIPSQLRILFSLNPMSVITNAYRQVLFGATMPILSHLVIAMLTAMLILLIGVWVFRRLEGQFADVI
jgi:ABC-type polysaccharide/polyol phosphate export permease